MKKHLLFILTSGLILAILISNAASVIKSGLALDRLRGSVLRLHILANSDSEYDQDMKLKVRDALLESGILSGAANLDEAEDTAQNRLRDIETLAELTLEDHGCNYQVTASLEDVEFDDREYGNMTMPKGKYKALRVVIGKGKGHNWWCVMYPPLCLPAACDVDVDENKETDYFDEEERDILEKPKKYKVRFAIWDKIKELRKDRKSETGEELSDTQQGEKHERKK